MDIFGGRRSRRAHPLAAFPTRSAYDGIARKQIGQFDLIAHSIAMITPGLSALGTGLLLPQIVGPGFWISMIIGFGVALMLASVFAEFSSRFSSGGSLHTFAAKGLGPLAALVACLAMVLTYGAQIVFGIGASAQRLGFAWTDAGWPELQGPWAGVLILGGIVVVMVPLLRGIRWSTRTVLVVEGATVLFVILVLVIWSGRYGLPDLSVLSLQGASFERIVHGVVLVAALTISFESAAILGLESTEPLHSVPRAMRLSLWILAALIFIASLAGTRGPQGLGLFTHRWLNTSDDVSLVDIALMAVLGLSLLAVALAGWVALSRLLFALSRDGLLPAWLGRTDKAGVPKFAVWIILPPVLALTGMKWAQDEYNLTGGWWSLVRAAVPVMFVAYALAAVALPIFLRRIDELTARTMVLSLVAAAGALGIAVDALIERGASPDLHHVFLVGVFAVAGLWYWRLAATDRLRRVGAHEPALRQDVYLLDVH